MGTFISPILKSESLVVIIETHLNKKNEPGMTITKERRIENERAKMTGMIIVQWINIMTL